jgi:glutamate racemase
VFRKRDGKRTDVVVLACTHYPLVIDEMKLVAPWEVSYLDPAPAIARRVSDVVADLKLAGPQMGVPEPDTVLLTSDRGSASESLAAYAAMGFPRHEFVDLPV